MYDGPIVDCDVHYSRRRESELHEHLAPEWRDFVTRDGGKVRLHGALAMDLRPEGPNRLDSLLDSGDPAGSDHKTMCEQLLDRYDVKRAVLTSAGPFAVPNGDLSHALCVAHNDWTRDRWLDGLDDDRLCGTILVETHSPEAAAAEVRRVGQDPRFVAVHVAYNSLGKPLGHPVYHPIYEAAAELGLPIVTHVNASEQFGGSGAFVAGGSHIHFRGESYLAGQQCTINHVVSMIVHGVFEKFPNLRYLTMEAGVSWLASLALKLDGSYDLIKAESRWVRRWPGEYLHDHVAVTTQPCEASAGTRRPFVEELSLVDGIEDMLCFSSDYPHWDSDDPMYISATLPKAWHDKVFHANAERILRLPSTDAPRRPAAAAA